MNKLESNYEYMKESFHSYIDMIKKGGKVDLYSIINTTLIKNPFTSNFPKSLFTHNTKIENKSILFIKATIKFYGLNLYKFMSYIIMYMIFNMFYNKKIKSSKIFMLMDIFLLVDNIIKDGKFEENYFKNLYPVLKSHNYSYVILPRLFGVSKNPFKFYKFIQIMNKDKRDFLFEFQLLSISDFVRILKYIILYPFKTLRLLQNGNTEFDTIFNKELLNDIPNTSFESFSRYILGKNIAKKMDVERVYSWSEFQVIERSFNFAIRNINENIKIYGCQFSLIYEVYFHMYLDDIDYEQKISPHIVLTNGKYNILKRDKIKYKEGVSLRYQNIFTYNKNNRGKNILLLGSIFEKDISVMMDYISVFDKFFFFKPHPALGIDKLKKYMKANIIIETRNIYNTFEDVNMIIVTPASGTAVEAVSCGISVIIVASQDTLTANPLIEYGKGKIWDIAFSKGDVEKLYNKLINYKENNSDEIKKIASWYKNNFFIEPTEDNIVKTFELEKG